MKPSRAFLGISAFLLIVTALPLSPVVNFRSHVYSAIEGPLAFSSEAAQFILDLISFKSNADENRLLKKKAAHRLFSDIQSEELRIENRRLTLLLNLRKTIPPSVHRSVVCRVIGRSSSAWNSTLLIDKGTRNELHPNMPVLSDVALVGKTIETGLSVSKVLMITDPDFRIGAMIQRTRQQGVLYGTAAGQCRLKYLSADVELKKGDVVETAGFGGFFPKGLLIGTVERAWKEPGQIYQVALIKPMIDLGRIEEVSAVD